MRSSGLLVLSVAMSVGMFLFPSAAGGAAPEFVEVCHFDADGDTENPAWRLIEVPDKAVARHEAHGDYFPGDEVPGREDYFFSAACVPQPEYYALAYVDADTSDGGEYNAGVDVLISKLVDGPGAAGDGVLGPGDIIFNDRYPRDLEASNFGEFGVKELVANYVTISVHDPEAPDLCWMGGVIFPENEEEPIHAFIWQKLDGSSGTYSHNDASQSTFFYFWFSSDIVLMNPYPSPTQPEDEEFFADIGEGGNVRVDILGCDF